MSASWKACTFERKPIEYKAEAHLLDGFISHATSHFRLNLMKRLEALIHNLHYVCGQLLSNGHVGIVEWLFLQAIYEAVTLL